MQHASHSMRDDAWHRHLNDCAVIHAFVSSAHTFHKATVYIRASRLYLHHTMPRRAWLISIPFQVMQTGCCLLTRWCGLCQLAIAVTQCYGICLTMSVAQRSAGSHVSYHLVGAGT